MDTITKAAVVAVIGFAIAIVTILALDAVWGVCELAARNC